MPRRSGSGGEVHGADAELRLPFGLDDWVDPHVAREPFRWTLDGRFPWLRLHRILLVEIGQRWSGRAAAGVVAQLASRSSASWERLAGSAL